MSRLKVFSIAFIGFLEFGVVEASTTVTCKLSIESERVELSRSFTSEIDDPAIGRAIVSEDIQLTQSESINLHIYYSNEASSINIFDRESDLYLNSDDSTPGKFFTLFARNIMHPLIDLVSIYCTTVEEK